MINVIGQFFDSSGYAIHTRRLANALNKITEVRVSTQLVPNFERLISDQELEMLKRKSKSEEINLIITHPSFWKLNMQAKRNWVFLVWEGDKVPLYFIEECLNPKIEYIFVPSIHTRNAIIKTIHEDCSKFTNGDNFKFNDKIIPKIKIMPHGVDLDLFYSKDKPNKLIFLCNKGWRNSEDRGGIQYAVKAFLEEFSEKDEVEMIVKINPAYGVPNLNELIKKLTNKEKDFPKLNIDINNYDYKDLVKLYNSANVFMAPSRAEAYNIPCIEAMACGLPVITTNFGGQTDYVDENNGWLIGGELTEVKHEIQYEGIKWLSPNVPQLKRIMRDIFNNQEIIQKKKEEALKTAKNNTWDMTAEKIAKLI